MKGEAVEGTRPGRAAEQASPPPEAGRPILNQDAPQRITPPPLPSQPAQPAPPRPESATDPPGGWAGVEVEPAFSLARVKGNLNWEQFMGAKLYAWIGGITLFLAAAFFIRYSFERGWFPPSVRAAMGYVLGSALLLSGARMRRKRYRVLSHTFCATGVLILYGVIFACRAVYEFALFGSGFTFALMAGVTAIAFVLSV